MYYVSWLLMAKEWKKWMTYQYMDPYPGRGKVRGAFWNLDQVFGKFYFKQTQKYLDKIKPDMRTCVHGTDGKQQ